MIRKWNRVWIACLPVLMLAATVMAQDEARTIYSQILMWGKDGEKYQKGSWLGWLEDLRKGL